MGVDEELLKIKETRLREETRGKLPLVETFLSIEGEGIRTGDPVVFVRFAGCNLRCGYCDTKYSHLIDYSIDPVSLEPNTRFATPQELTEEIMNYNCRKVTFTGGEPLLQIEYIDWFINNFPDFEVNIETNGSMPIEPLQYRNSIITMDYKCPSSGMESHMNLDNLNRLRHHDVLKFVVGTDEDLNRVLELIHRHTILAKIYLSPVFGQMDLQKLAAFVIEHRHLGLRMGLQIHKFIWDPNARGV